MKNILPLSIAFICLIFMWILTRPIEDKPITLVPNTPWRPIEDENIKIIKNINANNSKIISLYSKIRITMANHPWIRVEAGLAYEKPRNFRMIFYSTFGKEVDLGSNKSVFWFWSKRLRPQALYYANYTDLYKTRLKTPFHPIWIMESLGFGEIKTDGATFEKTDGYLKITREELSVAGEMVTVVRLINLDKLSVDGQYVYKKNELVASVEVLERRREGAHWVPKKLKIHWIEEGRIMTWDFYKDRYNIGFKDKSVWNMPDYWKTINIGRK